MARVHGGPRRRGQEASWRLPGAWHMGTRACWCSPAVVKGGEPDEAMSEGCSPKHERRWRGGATTKKTVGGVSSLRGQRKARGSSGAKGRGAVRAGGARGFI
jgi:hypothetical protein